MLATYMRRMRNNNLGFGLRAPLCRPQLDNVMTIKKTYHSTNPTSQEVGSSYKWPTSPLIHFYVTIVTHSLSQSCDPCDYTWHQFRITFGTLFYILYQLIHVTNLILMD